MKTLKRKKILLDGLWKYRLDKENNGFFQEWASRPIQSTEELLVPGCLQSLDSLSSQFPPKNGLQNSYKGTFWLEREFSLPFTENVLFSLSFFAAPTAYVWINGRFVKKCIYSQVRSDIEISSYITHGEKNRITIAITEENTGLMGGFRFNEIHWSGIYQSIAVTMTPTSYISDFEYTQPFQHSSVVCGTVANPLENCSIQYELLDKEDPSRVLAKEENICLEEDTFQFEIFTKNLTLWSPENPKIYLLRISLFQDHSLRDVFETSIGFRTVEIADNQILLNGTPLFIFGVGHEHFSPTISPLIDETIIRQRFQQLKDFGFNFCRYHTHVPTEKELELADEMGLLLCSEIGLVSNFHKTLPFEQAVITLERLVCQTRHHPSLLVYGLGNEGSQLMAHSSQERENALIGYHTIKKNTALQLAVIAFGLQGEVPELPNDFETPHLWSTEFEWSYDGLTAIPWGAFEQMDFTKPAIIHEYGKYGVWPNSVEEALYPKNGYTSTVWEDVSQTLEAENLSHYNDQFIKNSRTLASQCNKIILEEARCRPSVKGYTLWTFFRKGNGNAGLIDDMGEQPDIDPKFYRQGCNAPTALLMDRGFSGRTWLSGSQQKIHFFVSHFSTKHLFQNTISWVLSNAAGTTVLQGEFPADSIRQGENQSIGSIDINLPLFAHSEKLLLTAHLFCPTQTSPVATNSWDFWVFPSVQDSDSSFIVHDFSSYEMEQAFTSLFPSAVALKDLDSTLRGCYSWKGYNFEQSFQSLAQLPSLLVTDYQGPLCQLGEKYKTTVLLLDSGAYPSDWYHAPLNKRLKEKDPLYQYASFRSGWDHGNLATVVRPHDSLEGFVTEDFCDLHYFKMLQNSAPLSGETILSSSDYTAERIIFGVTKKRSGNITVAAEESDTPAAFPLLIREYLYRLYSKEHSVYLTSLNFFSDVAGKYLLKTLIENIKK